MSEQPSSAPLYASAEPIFPRRVSGWFRNLKSVILVATLAAYYLVPWLRWDRGEFLPDQAVLIDMANRRFFWFWIEIWPREFYFIAGLLIMAGLGLFLFGSILGRIWCGYSCPQTIWTDLFMIIERWIEGDRNKRVKLWNSKWTTHKITLRLVKWTLWLLISIATGLGWIFYFADAPTLFHDFFTLNAHPIAYTTVFILAMITFIFAGFMREQVCIYMCPWPRIQAAMMDEDTLTISYRDWRGEPRGKHLKAQHDTPLGDCIDCLACVHVCPMGIDIRNGQQLECISCGLCIDACDAVMDKTGKPRGLVGYLALSDENFERQGKPSRSFLHHMLRPRTLLYLTLWLSFGVMLLFALLTRDRIGVNITPVRNPLNIIMSDGSVRNVYELRLHNQLGADHIFQISLADHPELVLVTEGVQNNTVRVPADTTLRQRLYITAPPSSEIAKTDRTNLELIFDAGTAGYTSEPVVFNGRN